MANAPKPKFRPRARLLQLLGDQLIGSSRLAVFELVKNSYDADASKVDIKFLELGSASARISVRDNGEGMDYKTITEVWLEPGSDYRERQRIEATRSDRYGRLPLGEKGVGRFAVHKLGTRIELRTKRKNDIEYTVSIDWDDYSAYRYIDEAPVTIAKSKKPLFKSNESGTQVVISGLRESWTRGEIRRLWRNVKSISSPTKRAPDSFSVNLYIPQHKDWLAGLIDAPEYLKKAMWHFVFYYENGKFEWTYKFKPIPGLKVKGDSKRSEKGAVLKLARHHQDQFAYLGDDGKKVKRIVADRDFTKLITADGSIEQVGPVMGELYAFDRDKDVLAFEPTAKQLTSFLDENGGVRVYRDGIRVHNYGERSAGDDWLGLDQRRVNIPARRLSNNIIIGTVDISLAESSDKDHGLIEKTNREGFIENTALEKFKAIVLAALIEFESLRQKDKSRYKETLKTPAERTIDDLEDPINALRSEFEKRNLSDALGNHLKAIERRFHEMKDVMTHAGNAGLNLGILFHEIDRGVKSLTADIRKKVPAKELVARAEHLSELLDGFSTLLRKDRKKLHRVSSILREVKLLNNNRFDVHDVVFSCPVLAGEQDDFEINASLGMLLGAMSNLIDNSIYWLQVKWPESKKKKRAIYVGVSDYYEQGPALVIADNGVGLPSDASHLIKPFVTTKPDGMGLGLYYVNLVCELNNATLVISPDPNDVGLPKAYDGAAFAIVFNKEV